MFKPISYGYCNDSYSQSSDLIIGKSLLNTQYQYKLNEDKPILGFIKLLREEKEKKNLIEDKFIYPQNNTNHGR